MDEKILSVLCEINNRLSDIAISLQVMSLMNMSLDRREEAYKFLAGFLDVQKVKYLSSDDPVFPYNPMTGQSDS